MKSAAYFIAVLTFFLTMHPLLVNCQAEMQACETKAVCGATKCSLQKDNDGKEDDENSGGCNPFASCSQCHYLSLYRSYQLRPVATIITVTLFTAAEDIRSGFISDCWHPPEPGLS